MVHALKPEYDKQWANYQNNHFINFFNQKYKHFQLMCLKIYSPYLDCCFQTFVIEDMPHTVNINLHSKDFRVHWLNKGMSYNLFASKFNDIYKDTSLSWRDSSNWHIILQHIYRSQVNFGKLYLLLYQIDPIWIDYFHQTCIPSCTIV